MPILRRCSSRPSASGIRTICIPLPGRIAYDATGVNEIAVKGKGLRLICPGCGLLPRVQLAPLLQQLRFSLTMSRVGYAGIGRTHPGALRLIVGTDAFGASAGGDSMSSGDGLIGATRPAIPAVPGHSRALLGNNFVGYLRRSFPDLYEKLWHFAAGMSIGGIDPNPPSNKAN